MHISSLIEITFSERIPRAKMSSAMIFTYRCLITVLLHWCPPRLHVFLNPRNITRAWCAVRTYRPSSQRPARHTHGVSLCGSPTDFLVCIIIKIDLVCVVFCIAIELVHLVCAVWRSADEQRVPPSVREKGWWIERPTRMRLGQKGLHSLRPPTVHKRACRARSGQPPTLNQLVNYPCLP
jgi:hypothetical protein